MPGFNFQDVLHCSGNFDTRPSYGTRIVFTPMGGNNSPTIMDHVNTVYSPLPTGTVNRLINRFDDPTYYSA